MEASHLDELVELEDSYWWHIAKRRLVSSILKSEFPAPCRLVEGGIGSARNLICFQELGYEVHGLDIMPESVEHARDKGLANVSVHDLAHPWPMEEESVGVTVMLDVLEHLEDPVLVLSHIRNILQPGGGVVFTVPAYPFLYGDWDKRLGHYRRYTSKELTQHAREAGFEVNWMTHWNAFTFPAAVAVRSYQRLFPSRERGTEFPRVSPAVNRLLLSFAGMERWFVKNTRVPFGLSLVGVLRK